MPLDINRWFANFHNDLLHPRQADHGADIVLTCLCLTQCCWRVITLFLPSPRKVRQPDGLGRPRKTTEDRGRRRNKGGVLGPDKSNIFQRVFAPRLSVPLIPAIPRPGETEVILLCGWFEAHVVGKRREGHSSA